MFLIFISIITILLIVIIAEYLKKDYHKIKRNIQFAFSLPGASVLLSMIHSLQIACNYKELLAHVVSVTKKYESPSRFILGTDIFVLLTKPEDYKLVLANIHGNYKSSVTKLWSVFLGEGIIRASGAAHRLRRKIIQPLFNYKYLTEYVPFFDNYSNHCVDRIDKNINNNHTFDVKPYIARYTTDAFLTTFVGIQGTAYKGEYDELLQWQEKLMKLVYNRTIKPWLYVDWIYNLSQNSKQTHIALNIVQNFIQNMISQKGIKRNTPEQDTEIQDKPKTIFIEQLFEKHMESGVSNNEFEDDIRNLYFAMQNTITETTCFVLLMLAMHTETQEKLRKEILFTFENEKVDATRLSKMEYLNMVIQETLRLFPIASTVSRQLTADIKLDSYVLPEGCFVMIPIFAIHRNPMYWHDPEKFIPERFSTDDWSTRHRYTYFPFGTGLRDCLGQRFALLCLTTIVVNLIRRFRFETTTKMEDINLTTDILLRSRDGIKLSVSRV